MKNFTEKFKLQYEKKKEADSKSVITKEIKKSLAKKNINGKIVVLSPSQIKERQNIRDEYDYEQIESLAKDIVLNGQLEPVVITSDNYLLWGYRRWKALSMIISNPDLVKSFDLSKSVLTKFKKLVCYQINKSSSDISDEELQELQLSENNERRDIDNFHLSKLYNSYLEKGFSQSEICTKFSKSKAYVSAIVSLKFIDQPLVKYLKEFQVYGTSKEKFIAINSEKAGNVEKSTLSIYAALKKSIGWQPLYSISKNGDNLKEQKLAFLKLFRNYLTKEELNSDYFQGIVEEKVKDDDFVIAENQIKVFSKTLEKVKEKLSTEHHFLLERVNQDILALSNILQENNR